MDVRRALLNARAHWYHSATSSIHDSGVWGCGLSWWEGGSAPDPLVWDQGSKRKQREADIRVNVDVASLLRPPWPVPGPPWLFEWALGSGSRWLYHWCLM